MLVLSSPNVSDAPSIGPVYNVNAAVHNVNGGVYKVNDKSLSTLDTCVNKTHGAFTNVKARAPNSGGDVSKTSQVRSTYLAIIQLH